MNLFAAAWAYARKDLTIYLRDRPALLLSIALPVVLATIFGSAIGAMSGGSKAVGRVKLCVEDLDRSDRSKKLLDELAKTAGLEVKVQDGVRARVASGRAAAALLVPAGYGDDLAAGRTPKLVLYRDAGKAIEQQIIAGNLIPAVFRASGGEISRGMMRRGLEAFGVPKAGVEQVERMFGSSFEASGDALEGADGAQSPASGFDFAERLPQLLGLEVEDVVGEASTASKVASQAHAVAGIAVMMLLFGVVATGGTLLEERASGTLQRLQLTPVPGPAILLGKVLYSLAAGAIQLVVLFAYAAVVFDLPLASAPVALTVLSGAVVFAATGAGLALAVFCTTHKQLEGVSTLLILSMSALGGSWFPLAMTPAWFQTAGHFTLNAWAMDGYQGILWYGKGLAEIAPEIGVLLAIGAATTFLAWRGWKRRFELAP